MSPRQSLLFCSRWTVAFGLLVLAGCDLPKRPPLAPEDLERSAAVTTPNGAAGSAGEVLDTPGASFEGDWETWDAYFFRNQQVGYAHVKAEQIGAQGSGDVRYELESRLSISQGPLRILQTVAQTCTETYDGQLRDFEGSVSVGPATTSYRGTVSDGKLKVITVRGSSQTEQETPWNPMYRGLVALEQSLHQRPMKTKGEERTLKMLLPGRYELATARMKCLGNASVPLMDGELKELVEINCEIELGEGGSTFSTIWTENNGEIVRTHSPAMQLVSYRTNQERATGLSLADEPIASIPVQGILKEPQNAALVGYTIRPTAAAIRSKISVDIQPAPGQAVRKTDTNTSQVVVTRKHSTVGKGFVESGLLPSEGDTATNWYVDHNNGNVRKFVALAIKDPNATDQETALELTRAVHQNIGDGKNGRGFEKASRIAEYWVADSTGQAIFLTALLRSRKLPARLALGLKYRPGTPARMEYHAWTLAYVDQVWLHLDPSEGGVAAADRLVLATTDLSRGNEFDALLPLLETMRAIQVEVAGQK